MKSAFTLCPHNERGLTFLETVVALAVLSILLQAVLIWNQLYARMASRQFSRTEVTVQAWQGVSFMQSEIHDGKLYSVSSDGKELSFYNGAGEQITYRCNTARQLLRQVNGAGASVIANDVIALTFQCDPGRKGVTIWMKTGAGQETYEWQGFVAGRGA
jgi:Tfp pilus assembly protein FimT